jgi:hypothetical protein
MAACSNLRWWIELPVSLLPTSWELSQLLEPAGIPPYRTIGQSQQQTNSLTYSSHYIRKCSVLLILLLVFETSSCYLAQAGLEHTILLLQHPKCWDYRHVPPFLAQEMFGAFKETVIK